MKKVSKMVKAWRLIKRLPGDLYWRVRWAILRAAIPGGESYGATRVGWTVVNEHYWALTGFHNLTAVWQSRDEAQRVADAHGPGYGVFPAVLANLACIDPQVSGRESRLEGRKLNCQFPAWWFRRESNWGAAWKDGCDCRLCMEEAHRGASEASAP